MKKLILTFAFLISISSFVKVSAFDSLAEWKALRAILKVKFIAYKAKPNSMINKILLLEAVRLCIDNYQWDCKKLALKNYLNDNFTEQKILKLKNLKDTLYPKISNQPYDDDMIISHIKRGMIVYINKNYGFHAPMLIANSAFLSSREKECEERVINFSPALEDSKSLEVLEHGPILSFLENNEWFIVIDSSTPSYSTPSPKVFVLDQDRVSLFDKTTYKTPGSLARRLPVLDLLAACATSSSPCQASIQN